MCIYDEFSHLDLTKEEFLNISLESIRNKNILCFYFCRDTIKKLSVFSHSKPYFSTVNEYIELMISLIQKNETKMYSSKSDWLNLLNSIYPIKKDLIKCYL